MLCYVKSLEVFVLTDTLQQNNTFVLREGTYNLPETKAFIKLHLHEQLEFKVTFKEADSFRVYVFTPSPFTDNPNKVLSDLQSHILISLRDFYKLSQSDLSMITNVPLRTIQAIESTVLENKRSQYLVNLICYYVWGFFHGHRFDNFFNLL